MARSIRNSESNRKMENGKKSSPVLHRAGLGEPFQLLSIKFIIFLIFPSNKNTVTPNCCRLQHCVKSRGSRAERDCKFTVRDQLTSDGGFRSPSASSLISWFCAVIMCAFDRFVWSTDRAALLVDRSPAQQSVDRATIDRWRLPSPALLRLLWRRMPWLLLPLHSCDWLLFNKHLCLDEGHFAIGRSRKSVKCAQQLQSVWAIPATVAAYLSVRPFILAPVFYTPT